jgi:hypothetical protein
MAPLANRSLDAVCVTKVAQVERGKWRLPPSVIFESRMWMVVGVVAISTQFEPSPLYEDFCQWMGCMV